MLSLLFVFPNSQPDYEILKKTCNLWRNWEDIDDGYDSMISVADYFAENQDRLIPHAGPGHWNDPDTLLLGTYGLSYDQSKAQLAIWACIAAPFLLSNDLRTIKPNIKALILNKAIIAIDQDPLGIQGRVVSDYYRYYQEIDIWVRPVTPIINGQHSYAVAFVSRRTYGHPFDFKITLKELTLTNEFGYEVQVIIFIFYSRTEKFNFMTISRIFSTQPENLLSSTKTTPSKSA